MQNQDITRAHQDYLKTIYLLQSRGETANNSAIAQTLSVSPASATNMVKRLAEAGLIAYAPYQGVDLTPEGLRIALKVVRRHRLVELLLHEILEMPWDLVHSEAERIEHAVSDEVEDAIARKLGNPSVDPHGDPIPSKDGTLAVRAAERPLSELLTGETASVARVLSQDGDRLRYLGSMGLYPGTQVTVLEQSPFDGPLVIEVNGQQRILAYAMARSVGVSSSQ
ncbi:MAG: metal-dependent transcriptional regulator [Anaerolineae bacterium]|nr:metal-dependent transcriptional regulator [Anaerolineae bacterium]MCB0253723.1 metal-dependent transcriptional regulator [Anaerolineae bacterium]